MESNLVQNINALKSLPKNWDILDFEKVISDVSSGNIKIKKSNLLTLGKYPVIDQGKDLIAGYSNNENALIKTEGQHIIFGDHTRIFKFIDFPFVMGADGTKVLKLKDENNFLKYIYYFFQTLNIPDTGYNRHFKYLKSIKIPLPPLTEQKRIAKLLDTADKLREQSKKIIGKYDELTQSLFLEMFGDPITNPKGWEKVELEKITNKIGSGATPRGGKKSYKNKGISLIRSLNIHDNYFKYKDLAFIDNKQAEKLNNVIVEEEDVLFNITGASVARCCIVPKNILPARVNQHVSIIRCKQNIVNPIFIQFAIISKNSKKELLGIGSNGGTREAITKEQLEKYLIPLPPKSLQEEFAKRVELIEKQKAQAEQSLQKSEELFGALLQGCFK